MPSAGSRIRHFISNLKVGMLFTCRHLLGFGSRGAIDQELYCLVKNNQLVRVARGVYMLPGSPKPSALAVATIKAESFGKRILMHGADTAYKLGFTTLTHNITAFVCSGRSSSFYFDGEVIYLIGRSPRKLHLQDSLPGQVIRTMWHLGKEGFTEELIDRTYPVWSSSIKQLQGSAGLLTEWMNEQFYWGRKVPRGTGDQSAAPLFIDFASALPEFAELFNELDQKWPQSGDRGLNI